MPEYLVPVFVVVLPPLIGALVYLFLTFDDKTNGNGCSIVIAAIILLCLVVAASRWYLSLFSQYASQDVAAMVAIGAMIVLLLLALLRQREAWRIIKDSPQTVAAVILLLIAAPGEMPYGYYTFLRIFLCGWGIFTGCKALGSGSRIVTLLAFCVAILFNPVFKVELESEEWVKVDVASMMLVAGLEIVLYIITAKRTEKESKR